MREKRYRKPRRLPMFSEPQAAANYAVASALPGLIPTVSTVADPLRTRAARAVPATPAIPGLVKGVRAGYDGGKFYSETPFQAADAFWQARPQTSGPQTSGPQAHAGWQARPSPAQPQASAPQTSGPQVCCVRCSSWLLHT
jgi:hypothetical protein